MLIGIDGNEANIKDRVGVNEYAFELLWSMYRLQKSGEFKHGVIVYLDRAQLEDLPPPNKIWKYKVINGRYLWVLTRLMPSLLFGEEKLDVFFAPRHYLPPLSAMPKVCSIMDLGYLENSGQFKKHVYWQLKYWTATSLYVSKRIIAISNSTKNDIVRHYGFTRNKVDVTPLAYDKTKYNMSVSKNDVRRIKKSHSIVRDYFLYLGTLKPSKNIEGIIDAYHVLKTEGVNDLPLLVIAGKKGWLFERIFEKVKEKKLQKDIVFTGFIAESDKPGLYKGALALLTPSFWEGFGLHALESLACGTPVIASSTGSLPEVVGEVAIVVKPENSKDIAKGMKKVLGMDKTEYNMLIDKGLKQAGKYDWIKTARLTYKTLEKATKYA